jgi:hypothetical protein
MPGHAGAGYCSGRQHEEDRTSLASLFTEKTALSICPTSGLPQGKHNHGTASTGSCGRWSLLLWWSWVRVEASTPIAVAMERSRPVSLHNASTCGFRRQALPFLVMAENERLEAWFDTSQRYRYHTDIVDRTDPMLCITLKLRNRINPSHATIPSKTR